MVSLHHASTGLWWFLVELFYSLPDIANLGLAVGGTIMSFPTLAQQIEDKHRRRVFIACAVLGLGGFASGLAQRQSSEHQTAQLLTTMQQEIQSTNDLTKQMNTEAAGTNDLVKKMDTELTNSRDLITSARNMTAQQQRERRQSLLLNLTGIIDRLQTTLDQWRKDLYVEQRKTPLGKNDPDFKTQKVAWQGQYGYKLRLDMVEARNIREELYYLVPAEMQGHIGIPDDDSRLGRAANGELPSGEVDLTLIINDLASVHRQVSALSTPPHNP